MVAHTNERLSSLASRVLKGDSAAYADLFKACKQRWNFLLVKYKSQLPGGVDSAEATEYDNAIFDALRQTLEYEQLDESRFNQLFSFHLNHKLRDINRKVQRHIRHEYNFTTFGSDSYAPNSNDFDGTIINNTVDRIDISPEDRHHSSRRTNRLALLELEDEMKGSAKEIRKVLARMPVQYLSILQGKFSGQTIGQLADAHEIPEGTVKSGSKRHIDRIAETSFSEIQAAFTDRRHLTAEEVNLIREYLCRMIGEELQLRELSVNAAVNGNGKHALQYTRNKRNGSHGIS